MAKTYSCAVEVCPECDIADCKHIRARRATLASPSPQPAETEAPAVLLDEMAVYRQACDVRGWANVLGTLRENKPALLASIDRLRAMVVQPKADSTEPSGDLQWKFECFIDFATGGRLSKSSWALETLQAAVTEHVNQRISEALEDQSTDFERTEPTSGNWINADDVARLTHELDVAMNGEAAAAPHPSLCDVVSQAKSVFAAAAEGVTELAHELWAMAQGPSSINEACEQIERRLKAFLCPTSGDAAADEVTRYRTLDHIRDDEELCLFAEAWAIENGWVRPASGDAIAPWLTLAHTICTDRGIPQGHINDRLIALRDVLDASGDAKDAQRYRWLRDAGDATWRPFGIRAGYSAAAADAAIDAAIASTQEGGKP